MALANLLSALLGAAEPATLVPVARSSEGWAVGKRVEGKAEFHAAASDYWPAGMVPIFLVQKSDGIYLRRFPLKGQEGNSDALFFGLPLAGEAPSILGRWQVTATRQGTRHFFFWELTLDGTNLIGRFDRNSDYRFGAISEGTFADNKARLKVDYIMDAFIVTGELKEGVLRGAWKKTDGLEDGVWEATRDPFNPPASTNLVALFEWRRGSERAYEIEGKSPGPNWTRAGVPLCRVWK